jgi:tetratricopeptide (TPR) repeat protein
MLAAVCLCANAAEPAKASLGEITLPTYAWFDDPNPVYADYDTAIYYPYTRQDLIDKTKKDRTYKAVFIENEYLKVTCLPELGGRLSSVFDKTTNQEMFHRTDEVKPALIAMRGAWICGGVEWNVGPRGHTVTIVSPVDVTTVENDDGSATLVIGNTEKMFRTRWTVRVTLRPGKAFLEENIKMFNPTDGVHPYYFWNCAGFPSRTGTRFMYPITLGSDHGGANFFTWPMDNGKDLTWLKNYETMTSIFAYDCIYDFFGAYDVDSNRGIVSYANHNELKGKKAWTWGKDDFGVTSQMALSDAGRENTQYIEVQSGPLLTQAEFGMLKPHRDVAWREYWYPVHDLGDGFEYATRDVAAQASRKDGALEVRLIATGNYPKAVCTLSREGKTLQQTPLVLSPKQAETVQLPNAPEGPIKVEVKSEADILISYETPLAIPKVDPPDLKKKTAREDGQPTAEEKYQEAWLADRQSKPDEARKGYEAVLELDPQHIVALCGLAVLDTELGRWDDAAARAQKAIDRDPNAGMAWYWLGAARLRQGKFDEAARCGYKAATSLEAVAQGYSLVGRAKMRLTDYAGAVEAFSRANREMPRDAQNRDLWLLAMYAAGEQGTAQQKAARISKNEDPTDFVIRALVALSASNAGEAFLEQLNAFCGEKEFTLLEVVNFFAGAGRFLEANMLLDAYIKQSPAPLPLYYRAYFAHRLGQEDKAMEYLQQAARVSVEFVFPGRVEDRDILKYAVETNPNDAHAHLLYGYVLAGLRSSDEAVAQWQAAVDRNAKLAPAWRLLGLDAKKKKDLDRAIECFRKAVEIQPDDQLVYHDLAAALTDLKRRPEAIAIVEKMPKDRVLRYDVLGWLAEAYVAEGRYDDCITLLDTAQFSNWEGNTKPHDLFVAALLARGKQRFDAGQFEPAAQDFLRALTYPENLEVGAHYKLTDAEVRYWAGKALLALGRDAEAREQWTLGSGEISLASPKATFIEVTPEQDEHVKRCATALELLAIKK